MAEKVKPDFSGYATRYGILCSDGRTIAKDAFKDQDGTYVPLVFQHSKDDPENILGKALLEARDDGMYMYGFFNGSRKAEVSKIAVEHGDINQLSIRANRLNQKGGDVLHGKICEVSLVLAGANPGATIDCPYVTVPVLAHGEDAVDEAIIYDGTYIEHEDLPDKKEEPETLEHGEDKTIAQVIETMNDEQKLAMKALVAQALASSSINHSEEEDDSMKENAFEKNGQLEHGEQNADQYLTHEDFSVIADRARDRKMSMRQVMEDYMAETGKELAHAHTGDNGTSGTNYGIANLEYLFPDAQTLDRTPRFIDRDQTWVGTVLNRAKHSPFARVKTIFADITEDEARAKGYITGKKKKEEVFKLLKRETNPQTVYKKQRLDRDDLIDITWDVASWMKGEMRGKLNEELARAALIGDGRQASAEDKIQEDKIRPIWGDDELYTIYATITTTAQMTSDDVAKAMIKTAVKARKNYKGSGRPVMYTTEDDLTDMLLLEDLNGRRIYRTEQELAAAMRLSEIITVPVMENKTRTDGTDSKVHTLKAIIVNMNDYNFGADRGGSIAMFDDFDIDYNQYKYLIETRCSGALVVPYSAICIETVPGT
ncbi:phage major capsid family protein [Prevotella sp.]|uniref:phage major capsid family protein n=1 Tax=Prevotella sp. TaxID=59823 RepID=UPI0025F75B3B|nr:phage major capsid protein [Prevotella sp.]